MQKSSVKYEIRYFNIQFRYDYCFHMNFFLLSLTTQYFLSCPSITLASKRQRRRRETERENDAELQRYTLPLKRQRQGNRVKEREKGRDRER